MSSGKYSTYFTSVVVLVTLGMFVFSSLFIMLIYRFFKLIKNKLFTYPITNQESDVELQRVSIYSETEIESSPPSVIIAKSV